MYRFFHSRTQKNGLPFVYISSVVDTGQNSDGIRRSGIQYTLIIQY